MEVVRGCFDAWIRGDVDAMFALIDPDIEWHHDPDDPEASVTRGRTEVHEMMTHRWAYLGSPDFDVESIEDLGDEVFLDGRYYLQGVESSHLYTLWRVVNGKVARVRAFWHRDQALQAVGLEQAP